MRCQALFSALFSRVCASPLTHSVNGAFPQVGRYLKCSCEGWEVVEGYRKWACERPSVYLSSLYWRPFHCRLKTCHLADKRGRSLTLWNSVVRRKSLLL